MNSMNETAKKPETIKVSEFKTLVKSIIQEIKMVKAEHRGAKGSKVGMVRSKNFPQGKSGQVASKVSKTLGGKGNEEELVKKFLGKAKSTDNLLDLADVLGIKIPPTVSRFDPAEVAKVILDTIYKDDPRTGELITDKVRLQTAYNFLMAAGIIKESVSTNDEVAPVVEGKGKPDFLKKKDEKLSKKDDKKPDFLKKKDDKKKLNEDTELKVLGPNATVITRGSDDFKQLFFSYETLVAVSKGGQAFVTNKKYSNTTTKHIGKFLKWANIDKSKVKMVTPEELQSL